MTFNWPSQLRVISTFIRASDARSFSKAARELGVTPQAVSSQVKQLEEWAGVVLFRRTTRRISLTEEGASFYEHCRVGIDAIDEGVRNLRDAADEASGTVVVSVPYYISRTYILPILSSFLREHPRVSVELIAQNEYPDFVGQGIDIAVMSRHLPRNSFIARKIASVKLILCAAPAYLQRNGHPKTPEDMRHHRCVVLRHPLSGKMLPWTFQRGRKIIALDVAGSLTTNDTDTQRQAVLQGIGVGQLASFFAAPHIRDKTLKTLLMGYVAPPISIYLCMANRSRIPKKTTVLFEFLERELSRHPDFQHNSLRT
jgi:DNA-binding transcriptional LysR family regulator